MTPPEEGPSKGPRKGTPRLVEPSDSDFAAAVQLGRPYAEALRAGVDWLWQTDAEGNLTYVSHALPEVPEGPGESWIGRSLLGLAQGEASEATPSPLLIALRERRPFRDCTVEWTTEAQRTVRFRLTGLPYYEPRSGGFAGFRGTGSATSEPAEQTQTARELLDLLRSALSERDQLQQQLAEAGSDELHERLAGIAHELRTPLNAIIGFSELIRDQAFGNDPERYSEYGANIHRSGVRLLQLVNRILDTAEHEGILQSVEARPMEVEDIVRETIETLADTAAAARVSLFLDLADDLPRVMGDRQMTRQILFHALSRALERAPEDWYAGIRARQDGDTLKVAVWDGPSEEAAQGPIEAAPETPEAGAAGDEEDEDLGPVVLEHLARTMGADFETAGRAGAGSRVLLRLALAPKEPD